MSNTTVAGWLERMKELTREYNKEDVWNVDESGCFFRAGVDPGFHKGGCLIHGFMIV